MQRQGHESNVQQAIIADNAKALVAALDRQGFFGAFQPDVNMATEGALLLATEGSSVEVQQTLLKKGAEDAKWTCDRARKGKREW